MQRTTTASFALLLTTLLTVATPLAARAQSTTDRQQMQLAQIQTDARTIVLQSMDLDDTQVAAFMPIYDAYQVEYKKIMDRAVALIDDFASNYDSMTDDAARDVLKDWFRLMKDEDDLIGAYARKMGKVLPPTKVLRFVQIQNKLSAILHLAAVQNVPLAQ